MSPGVSPCAGLPLCVPAETPGPGRGVSVGTEPALEAAPRLQGARPGPRDARKAPVPLWLSPALPQHQPREPGRALGAPVLGLSAGAGRGGRERRGERDAADKLRLFGRRQERGDEREAPGGSGCAV